jgi:hypothetical protein
MRAAGWRQGIDIGIKRMGASVVKLTVSKHFTPRRGSAWHQ